jgi:YfiH family protein
MDWKLISETARSYFQFRWHDNIAIYTTKRGQENITQPLNPVFLKQIHSDTIIDIDSDSRRIGDGLLSRKRACLGVKVADCLPVYLFSDARICIIHCGWRGIVKGIVKNAKKMMQDFHYALGPSIGPCCYEVQQDVVDLYTKEYNESIIVRDKQFFLDLKAAVRLDLGDRTLLSSLDLCTKCHPEYFYSHRNGDKERNYGLVLYSDD